MASHLRFTEDHSDYDPTDSDEDYTENEKILLKKVRNRQSNESESEGEVFAVGSEASEDNEADQSDIALSDVEGQDDKDDLPDARAWGKNKRKFYSTDYVDPDYGGFQGKDAQLAELEEEEARRLQKQLAEQLDDDDFILDISTHVDGYKDEKLSEEIIKSDLSKLSKSQKLQILQTETPEFFGLLGDFKDNMEIVKGYLSPLLKKYKKGQIRNCSAVEFVTTQHELSLNYCINIYMYLLLKSSRINIQNHPVIKRMYQYKQLLSQLMPIYEEIMKPQVELLISQEHDGELPKKTLNVLNKLTRKATQGAVISLEKKPGNFTKKVKFNEQVVEKEISVAAEPQEQVREVQEIKETDVSKRAITYQIAKNKGLTPQRKKQQRNPRVKHRNKFRKAKIRRKGAVRETRTEVNRYGGEISGIKAGVSKSIQIRT